MKPTKLLEKKTFVNEQKIFHFCMPTGSYQLAN